jgi:hypothetical protein
VTIGVDLTKMNTVGDLQGGIEEAERLLGYKVLTTLTVGTVQKAQESKEGKRAGAILKQHDF